ncbi:unnamed protein product [Pneumocystis jirovecii]|uniref:Shugoshin C-terminal domain-containing protein n=2 Tax=Pneumocystis jirovecii TaxID=42068 RepID=L0PH27_PNEJI|nr:uncharacterized protein T551_00668 [Pneumocystis jirovecii RU7]KTW31986.1 hypothetical protein T551_00668 [Pneumocystis jirovecii RU7]CCJ30935.1 unnamed protein product [Pneumocystis jirovecii]
MYVHVENGQESFEAFKRKHLRQNREIIRLNMLQSVKVRQLEIETGRLLQENFELRASLISLQEQHEKEKKRSQSEELGVLKKILENKLSEITDIVQNMLPESSFIENVKNHDKLEKLNRSLSSLNSMQSETYLNEKLKKKTCEAKKIEKNAKKSFNKPLNNKQTNTGLVNSTYTSIADDKNNNTISESMYLDDSPFTYIEKNTINFADKNIEPKQIKGKKTPDCKKICQNIESNDTSDDFIYTKTKTITKDKKEIELSLKTSNCKKTKDISVEKENIFKYELSYLKEKKNIENNSIKNVKTSETTTRKILELKPSIANKKFEAENELNISEKTKTKNSALHNSESLDFLSPERRVGRTKKPINYTLPSLKTKMRRDDIQTEEENINKNYSKKKNISEDQLKNSFEESNARLLHKKEKNTDISFSSQTKYEKTPSVIIQKTALLSKQIPFTPSIHTQKNSKSKNQSILESSIKFNEKTTEEFDSLSSFDEELDIDIPCMNKKKITSDSESQICEENKNQRTTHELSKIKNPLSFISEYKDIQSQNEILTRRKSMLA